MQSALGIFRGGVQLVADIRCEPIDMGNVDQHIWLRCVWLHELPPKRFTKADATS